MMNNNELIMGFLSEKRNEFENKKKSNSKVAKLTESKKAKKVTESIDIAELLPDYDAEYTENASLMDINNIVDKLKEAGFVLTDWLYSDEDGEGWEFISSDAKNIVDVYLDGDILKIFTSEAEDE